MCGAVRVDVGELPQTVRSVVRCDEPTIEVLEGMPLLVQGVGIADVEVDTGGRAQRIVLGPLGEVDRHRPAVDKAVSFRTFVAAGVESEPAVAIEGEIQIPDGDDWRYRVEVDSGHTTVWQLNRRTTQWSDDHTTNPA